MPQLRNYQQKLQKDAKSGLQSPQARVMLQLPTGGGKTVIAGELLSDHLNSNRKAAAVWLTHRKELADQTCEMLKNAGLNAESRPRWQSGDDAPRIDNGVAILMAQSVARREPTWTGYGENDLMVVDEAHHATAESWRKAIQWWPGPVLGMTATPWRLSGKEGFDHLFDDLLLGPQVHQLQDENHLCQALLMAPDEEGTILGGKIAVTGDYDAKGIDQANKDRPNVFTTGVLRFWQKHAEGRQTVIYAVSVGHAENLEKEFTNAGISAAAIHNRTSKRDRTKVIQSFRDGNLTALINVAIATEGFDLPDASCVVLARPTMSLALYLQMVGRGLRPKPKEAQFRDCLILDMAGNARIHGLPEDEREWFLEPKGEDGAGQAPFVHCMKCDGVSAAASHFCRHCGTPFGKDCQRCGKWRVWGWWLYKRHCGDSHALVCDLCHLDVHLGLPPNVTGEAHQLLDAQINGLWEEIRRIEVLLEDEKAFDKEFDAHLSQLPEPPNGHSAINQEFSHWRGQLKSSRERSLVELSRIESANSDDSGTLEQIRQWLQAVLPRTAEMTQTMAVSGGANPAKPAEAGRVNNALRLTAWRDAPQSLEVVSIQPPTGTVIPWENTDTILVTVSEWLVKEGYLTREICPILQSKRSQVRCMINTEPRHLQGVRGAARFEAPVELSNGLYLENDPENDFADTARCEYLLQQVGLNPSQFRVNVTDNQDESSSLSLMLATWGDLATWGNESDFLRVESLRTPEGQVISGKMDQPEIILTELAEWLVREGHLQKKHCPVKSPDLRVKRFLINDKPVHGNGNKFKRPAELSDGLFLETDWNDSMLRRCVELINHCGQNPDQFRVSLTEIPDGDVA